MPNITVEEIASLEKSSQDQVSLKKAYVEITGDLISGILLSQIMYWYTPRRGKKNSKLRISKNGEMWIAKTIDEWRDETYLSRHQTLRAFKDLENLGIIESRVVKYRKLPTKHIRIVPQKFIELYSANATNKKR